MTRSIAYSRSALSSGGAVTRRGLGPKYSCTLEILTVGCARDFGGNCSVTMFVPTLVTWKGPSAIGANFLFSLSFLLSNTQSPSLINAAAILFLSAFRRWTCCASFIASRAAYCKRNKYCTWSSACGLLTGSCRVTPVG